MDIPGAIHAYIGIKPCGHVNAMIVGTTLHRRDTAKKVSRWILDGWEVDRVTIEKARQMLYLCDCEEQMH